MRLLRFSLLAFLAVVLGWSCHSKISPPPSIHKTFVLQSHPEGAEVWSGDGQKLLGRTPVILSFSAQKVPEVLLKKAGFYPQRVSLKATKTYVRLKAKPLALQGLEGVATDPPLRQHLEKLWGMGVPYTVALSPVGQQIAVGTARGGWLFDKRDFSVLAKFALYLRVVKVAFSSRGAYLAALALQGSQIWLLVYTGRDLQLSQKVKLAFRPEYLAFSPDERWLALGGSHTLQLLQLPGLSLHSSHVLVAPLRGLAFSPLSLPLICVTDKGIYQWQGSTLEQLFPIPQSLGAVFLNSRTFVVVTPEQLIEYDLEKSERLARPLPTKLDLKALVKVEKWSGHRVSILSLETPPRLFLWDSREKRFCWQGEVDLSRGNLYPGNVVAFQHHWFRLSSKERKILQGPFWHSLGAERYFHSFSEKGLVLGWNRHKFQVWSARGLLTEGSLSDYKGLVPWREGQALLWKEQQIDLLSLESLKRQKVAQLPAAVQQVHSQVPWLALWTEKGFWLVELDVGSLSWHLLFQSSELPERVALFPQKKMFVSLYGKELVARTIQGRLLWRRQLDVAPQGLVSTGTLVVGYRGDYLWAWELEVGRLLWQRSLPYSPRRLWFSTKGLQVTFLDPYTGVEHWERLSLLSGQSQQRLSFSFPPSPQGKVLDGTLYSPTGEVVLLYSSGVVRIFHLFSYSLKGRYFVGTPFERLAYDRSGTYLFGLWKRRWHTLASDSSSIRPIWQERAYFFPQTGTLFFLSKSRQEVLKAALNSKTFVTFAKFPFQVETLFLSPEGNYALFLHRRGEKVEAVLTHVPSGRVRASAIPLSSHQALALSPKGRYVAYISPKPVLCVQSLSFPYLQRRFSLYSPIVLFGFLKTRTLLYHDGIQTLSLWDLETYTPLERLKPVAEQNIFFHSLSGELVALVSTTPPQVYWRSPQGNFRRLHPPIPFSHVAFYPKGSFLAFSSKGKVYLWDKWQDRRVALFFYREEVSVTSLQFSPKGDGLCVSYSDGVVIRWDLKKVTLEDSP